MRLPTLAKIADECRDQKPKADNHQRSERTVVGAHHERQRHEQWNAEQDQHPALRLREAASRKRSSDCSAERTEKPNAEKHPKRDGAPSGKLLETTTDELEC